MKSKPTYNRNSIQFRNDLHHQTDLTEKGFAVIRGWQFYLWFTLRFDASIRNSSHSAGGKLIKPSTTDRNRVGRSILLLLPRRRLASSTQSAWGLICVYRVVRERKNNFLIQLLHGPNIVRWMVQVNFPSDHLRFLVPRFHLVLFGALAEVALCLRVYCLLALSNIFHIFESLYFPFFCQCLTFFKKVLKLLRNPSHPNL